MSLRWCDDCHTHHWDDQKCYPEWTAWQDGDEEVAVRARDAESDAESAAERWAEDFDESTDFESGIACNHRSAVVSVRGPDGQVTRWKVEGEMVPSYSAKPAD